MKSILGRGVSAMLLLTATYTQQATAQTDQKQLVFISNSHLDTQWNWDVRTTINEYIKNTLTENFALLDKYPSFQFNFEGAIKYMWMKEYYPDEYKKLKKYIADGRWHVSGLGVDANDVITPSAESIIRNYLYGHHFFEKEFNVWGGHDIMLPDCFGFSYALPSIGKHCSITGFHTAKLAWGSPWYDQLPPWGIWQGVDGSQIYAIYKPHAYDSHEDYNKDMSNDLTLRNEANANLNSYGLGLAVRYVGPRSDHGGGLHDDNNSSTENTPYWLNYSVNSDGPLKVKLLTPDDLFKMMDDNRNSKYPVWDKDLLMSVHGAGGYTSKANLKLWNRKTELLADAAEKSSSLAQWIGSYSYPSESMRESWIRMLWQQHHDGITGTSIPNAYLFSENDYILSNKEFARIFTDAAGATAKMMDTQVEGTPVVVYNPLSFDRTDVVEGTMAATSQPDGIQVFDKDGNEVLAQITGYNEAKGELTFIFAATVPSLGYAVYDVRTGTHSNMSSDLTIKSGEMSNGRYKVTVNSKGDVASLYDNTLRKTLLTNVRQQVLRDKSTTWPAWEVLWDDISQTVTADDYVDGEPTVTIAENGPLRVSFRITRNKLGSDYVQYVRMNALSNRIDFVNEVDWQTKGKMLKVCFPFMFGNENATFDLSLGAVERGNRNEKQHEVPGHQWADVTMPNGTCGISILNDCKYGWDKPSNNSLRLTLIRTPEVGDSYTYQSQMDLGVNKFTYSIFPHDNKWSEKTQIEASRLNQPLVGFITPKHDGVLGRSLSFISLNTDKVALKAVKKAETSDEMIIRVYEWSGSNVDDVQLTFPADILSAREVSGIEETVSGTSFSSEGKVLSFSMSKFQPRTFAVTLAPSTVEKETVTTTPVDMAYNIDVMSPDTKREDATAGIQYAYPSELIADNIVSDGISFTMGSRENGSNNAVRCAGQTITLNRKEGQNKLYILAASTLKSGSLAEFTMGGNTYGVTIPYYGGFVGGLDNAFNAGTRYRRDNVALNTTHTHNTATKENETYSFLYMYKYAIPLADDVNAITLPDNPDVIVFAASLSDNTNDDIATFTPINNYIEYTELGDNADNSCGQLLYPATVKASSQVNSNEAAAFAADMNEFTKWCSTNRANPYLEYDLGEEKEICQWMVLNAGCENEGYITSGFKLQKYSGGTWSDVDVVTGNTDNKVVRGVAPFKTQRVRLTITKGEQNAANTARIYEFAVFGKNDVTSAINGIRHDGSSPLRLIGNYPNPYNNATTVQCDVPDGVGKVTLNIYTLSGQKVESRDYRVNGSGLQQLRYQGNLSDGMYIYILTAKVSGHSVVSNSGKMVVSSSTGR